LSTRRAGELGYAQVRATSLREVGVGA
jgi:hypothetical protein